MENATTKAAATSAAPKAGTSNAPGILKRSSSNFLDARVIGRVKGWNNRFDFGEIEELAKSLAVNGMLNPIRVKRTPKPCALVLADNGIYVLDESTAGQYLFELVDGDRRLTALELLMKQGKYDEAFPDGIPAIIVDKAQDSMTSLVQMFEANTGKPLLPLEEAAAYKRMRDGFPDEGIKGLTIKQICERVGRKQVHVTEMLALLDADEDVKDAVTKGTIGKTQAKQIAKVAKGDKAKQKELVAKAKNAKGDRNAKQKVQADLQKTRSDKAKAKGKTLKIRALNNAQLSELGAQVAAELVGRLSRIGMKPEDNLAKWIKGDAELVAAYMFGALTGLRAAAGQEEELVLDVVA